MRSGRVNDAADTRRGAELGAELRRAREARGETLRAVAAVIGISPSLLSQVETGKTNPSVSTLYALVTHLGVSIDVLMGRSATSVGSAEPTQPQVTASVIQTAADTPRLEMENGVTWERLAVSGGHVDPLLTTYESGGASSIEGKLMRHSGTEYGYLIEGELVLVLGFDRHVLHAGDSLCFDSTQPHMYINESSAVARGLWFVVGRDGSDDAEDDGRPMRSAVDVLQSIRALGA